MKSSGIRKRWLGAGAAVTAMSLLAACSGGGSDPGGGDAYKVAIIADLTGSAATYMATGLPGTLTVIDRVNKDGGVHGHKIEITGTYDSGSTGTNATVAARSAIGSEPNLILNLSGDTSTAAVVPLVAKEKIPMLSTYLSADLAAKAGGAAWGFIADQNQQAQFALESVKSVLGKIQGARIAYEYIAESPSAGDLSKQTQHMAEAAGATTVDAQAVSYTATSFASQAAHVAALNPDLYVVSDGASAVQMVTRALRTAGWNGPVITAGDSANAEADFKGIADPKYYAPRAYQAVTDTSEIAVQAKTFGHQPNGAYVPYGWSQAEAAVAALGKCDTKCSAQTLTSIFSNLGELVPSGNATVGPLLFQPGKATVVRTVQLYRWDAAEGATVPVGAPYQAEPSVAH